MSGMYALGFHLVQLLTGCQTYTDNDAGPAMQVDIPISIWEYREITERIFSATRECDPSLRAGLTEQIHAKFGAGVDIEYSSVPLDGFALIRIPTAQKPSSILRMLHLPHGWNGGNRIIFTTHTDPDLYLNQDAPRKLTLGSDLEPGADLPKAFLHWPKAEKPLELVFDFGIDGTKNVEPSGIIIDVEQYNQCIYNYSGLSEFFTLLAAQVEFIRRDF